MMNSRELHGGTYFESSDEILIKDSLFGHVTYINCFNNHILFELEKKS